MVRQSVEKAANFKLKTEKSTSKNKIDKIA